MKIYHLIIVDASGSMTSIERQALSGCNENLQNIRRMAEEAKETAQHFVSLVTFNSLDRTHLIYDAIEAAEAADLPASEYTPDGCTPLYDCVGLSVSHLQDRIKASKRQEADEKTNVLVTIITDGMENSSTLFNADKVRSLIEECKQQGWTFAFIGAYQDEVLEAGKLGIHNAMHFECDEEGTHTMFSRLANCTTNYCFSIMHEPAACRSFEDDFFGEKEQSKEKSKK